MCRLSLASVARSLDSLAYEQVNDVALREQLRASRGFCPHHAWQLAHQPSSALGVAIIYRDVLGEVMRILEEGSSGGLLAGYRRKPTLASRLLPQASCPICANLADSEGRYLSTLIDHLPEPDFAEIYLSHSGLCLPHLERALSYRLPHRTATILLSRAANSLGSALESPSDPTEDGRSSLAQLLVGGRGALTRREVPILPPSDGAEDTKFAEYLLSALPGGGCPVCAQLREVDNRPLGRAIEEDRETHPSLCHLHTWQLSEHPDSSAADALLHLQARSVLSRLAAMISDSEKEGRRSRGGVRLMAGDVVFEVQPCAVESERAEVEIGWARALARSIRLSETQAAFRRTPGLCLPHLAQALNCSDPAGARTLASLEAERIGVVVGDLDEYIRKHDYRFREEPWGQEVTAPRRAVELVVGEEGLRGVGGLWWPD